LVRDQFGGYQAQRNKPERRAAGEWKKPITSATLCGIQFERHTTITLPVDFVCGVENTPIKVRLEEYAGRGKCFVVVKGRDSDYPDDVDITTKKGVSLVDMEARVFRLISGCRLKRGVPKTLRLVRVKD
jgi:hypothetical protein